VGLLLKLLSACRNLERVADLATNIAEDVVYMVDGQIIRHQTEADEVSEST
jgi:phosphate transport system protein